MSRNIFENKKVEDVVLPEYPEETPVLAVQPETEEDFAELDARIAELEAEESLTTTAQAILHILRKARAEAGQAG